MTSQAARRCARTRDKQPSDWARGTANIIDHEDSGAPQEPRVAAQNAVAP